MNELTCLIKEDMIPAFGVTEPGAVAFAVATAREKVRGEVQEVIVVLNKGVYKNSYTCGVPNSSGYGNLYAAALGAVAADAKLGLESLSLVTEEDDELARILIDGGRVSVDYNDIGSEIYINACVKTVDEECCVLIRDSHINVVEIKLNGTVVYENNNKYDCSNEETSAVKQYSLKQFIDYCRRVPIEEIEFISSAFDMNMDLFKEGLMSPKTSILKYLLSQNDNSVVSGDFRNTAQLLCNGTIEARVIGLSKPAMSITGSGSHGIICTMPLLAYKKTREKLCTKEMLLRGTALSYLVTMYIKEYSGKLSAMCGCGVAAGTGMACGLALMMGASEAEISMVIGNMSAGITGMICDGGNRGCAMKGITAVDAAIQAVHMAMAGVAIESIHGINGNTPEETMRNMGLIATPGMTLTEDTILDIMRKKGL